MDQAKKTYLVGFSGGADSTAALLWAAAQAQKCGSRVVAVHFNHHLRGSESDAEAAHAAAFAAARKVEFRLIDLDIAPGGNLESRARHARLDAWKNLCGEYDDPVVITGHHQDDRIENMFLRIGRGSNVSGLTGLQECAEVGGVKFFRPLLHWSRMEIEEFLRSENVDIWAVDSSNLTCDYARNALRNKILPELYRLFPGGRNAVAQTLDNLAADAEYLERETYRLYRDGEPETVDFWQKLPPALLPRAAQMFVAEKCGGKLPLNRSSLQRFSDAVRAGSSGIVPLSGSRSLRISGGRLSVNADTPPALVWNRCEQAEVRWGGWILAAEPAAEIPVSTGRFEAYFDGETLPEILTVGAAEPGEKMLPFGGTAAVKIKKLRIDRKIPAFPAVPVVRDGDGRVLWVAGVRHSDHCKVEKNRRCIRIFAEKAE